MQPISLSVPYAAAGCSIPATPPTLMPCVMPKLHDPRLRKMPAVIICPGGGYDYCSEREALPIAMRFAANGVQAFVLQYSCQMPFPTDLLELAAALQYVRSHAAEYDIDPARIAVCGFSAGGHLAASLAVYWQHPALQALGNPDSYRPNAQILCYPVITAGIYTHAGSIANLIGAPADTDAYRAAQQTVSLETQVTDQTPPCFLWHTSDDNCVPVQNSLLYLTALGAKGVPFESHIYPHGGHGLALCDETTATGEWHLNPTAAEWFAEAVSWVKRGFGEQLAKNI